MRLESTILTVALSLSLVAGGAGADTKLQVNANANQFPYVSIRVRAYDSSTGKAVSNLTKDKFLIAEDLSPAAIENFKVVTSDSEKVPLVDVMFVFDQTGSMGDEIAGLLLKTQKFADLIAKGGIDYRLGLVSFSDKTEKQFPYTSNVDEFKKNVASLTAEGGADEPENQLDAVMDAKAIPSRPEAKKVFILVTDASYHFQDSVTKRRPEEIISSLKEQGIQLHVVGPELDSYKKMSQELAGNFYDKDSDDFSSIVTAIGGEISANYEFGFTSPRAFRDGTRRAVRVALQGDSGTDASQYVAPWFTSSSSRRDASEGDESQYSPHKVIDGDAKTSWFPSDVGMADSEWITLTLQAPRPIAKVTARAAVGETFSEKMGAVLSLDGGEELQGAISEGGALLTFTPKSVAPISRIILSLKVAGGAKAGISEIEAFLPDGSLIPEIAQHHISKPSRDSAKELNSKGEKAYHGGKLEESVKLYQSAIEADPEFAQAYSNLGLSYWKLKDYPKSVAANRSAIALGKQQGKSAVIANSYYNIARTFEEQKEYKQALMNFWWANKTSPKPVYETAIARMNKLIAKDAE